MPQPVLSIQPKKRERGRRVELQRMLGDLGTVLERQAHGSIDRPAQGWYACMAADGEVVFLGDYSMLAALRIQQLVAHA